MPHITVCIIFCCGKEEQALSSTITRSTFYVVWERRSISSSPSWLHILLGKGGTLSTPPNPHHMLSGTGVAFAHHPVRTTFYLGLEEHLAHHPVCRACCQGKDVRYLTTQSAAQFVGDVACQCYLHHPIRSSLCQG